MQHSNIEAMLSVHMIHNTCGDGEGGGVGDLGGEGEGGGEWWMGGGGSDRARWYE